MKKVILGTLVGIVLLVVGIYIAYIYLTGIDTGSSPLLLGLSIVLLGFGIFCLFRAGKSDDTVMKKVAIHTSPLDKTESISILDRNNQLTEKWKKTIEQKDRLKLLQISGSANKDTGD